jgi:ABC-type branched-subunit amino acid transport system ATPase component
MTDEETERTAELFLSLAGKHSLVVVEHDMGADQDRQRSRSTATTSPATPYERARKASASCRRAARSSARLTVEENLRMGLAYKPRHADIPDRVFELFPVLKQMLGRRGGDLSGGQQQQLAIGRALAMPARSCCCSTSRPKASSPRSSRTSAA